MLLKNEGILPLQPQKIALYGAGARMTVKGGTGSGNMQERYSVTIEEGLINAGFEIVSGRWLERFDESFAKEKEEWRLGIEEKLSITSHGKFRKCLMRLFTLCLSVSQLAT